MLQFIQEELQHLEMTTGFSEGLRSQAMPRRCVKIKRPGKPNKSGNGNNGLRTGVRLHVNDSRAQAQHFSAGMPGIAGERSLKALCMIVIALKQEQYCKLAFALASD